ncbi:MAG: PP2C family protein-serine/threonine phosphatase [Firmicutes bacterium]|nr:PP2C family protein-serine/threonine phosphatase [Bacillota bacterium]
MKISLDIVFIWTFAVSLSGVMSALICGITLKSRYTKSVAFWGYALAFIIGFLISFLLYNSNISNDFGGIVVMSVLIWIACLIVSAGHWSSKWFVAIMATLISNVSTFFICGPTLSFIDETTNPYNIITISIFIGLKIVLFTILFVLYKIKLREKVHKVIDALSGKMSSYLPVAIVSFFGFYIINVITNNMGIIPSAITIGQINQIITLPDSLELRYIFIALYGVISLIFILEFWQMFASVFWSSRAHKTEAELNIANKIQQDMLPCIFPAFPDRADFDIYASMQPVKEVGGDFYDFFLVNDNTLAVVIADVSDKGIPAALFMVITKTLIKNTSLSGKSPKEVFETVNNMLCENNEAGMFVTAFLGFLDIISGKFTYVNAGHNLPLLRSGSTNSTNRRFDWLKAKPGFVLAGMEDMFYKQEEIILRPGDELFLYTDGVTEAANRESKLFGSPRLIETANEYLDLPLKEFTISIKRKIEEFANGAEQADDITMLALRYKGKGTS